MTSPMVLAILDRQQKSWDEIITCVFAMLQFSQYKQKSLKGFEATLAANYSTVPSEGWFYTLFRKKIPVCVKYFDLLHYALR